jgi:hypothetical protein
MEPPISMYLISSQLLLHLRLWYLHTPSLWGRVLLIRVQHIKALLLHLRLLFLHRLSF